MSCGVAVGVSPQNPEAPPMRTEDEDALVKVAAVRDLLSIRADSIARPEPGLVKVEWGSTEAVVPFS